jgi:hypothetical protein
MVTHSNSGFSSKPSTSQAFESPSSGYTDLSALAPKAFDAPLGESMAGGNLVTDRPSNGLPGSSSEQTAGIHLEDIPALESGASQDYTHNVDNGGFGSWDD